MWSRKIPNVPHLGLLHLADDFELAVSAVPEVFFTNGQPSWTFTEHDAHFIKSFEPNPNIVLSFTDFLAPTARPRGVSKPPVCQLVLSLFTTNFFDDKL